MYNCVKFTHKYTSNLGKFKDENTCGKYLPQKRECKNLEESWDKKYSLALKTWRNNWTHASTFFKYPQEIRKIM